MFKIATDSASDLPLELLEKYNVACVNLSYILDGVTYGHGEELSCKDFYNKIREGAMPTTSQVNPDEAIVFLEDLIKSGEKEILYLAFSSGLSGTYNSGRIAAEELNEKYPDVKIIVIDTLCASMGQGLIVYQAVKLRDKGLSMEEVAKWCEDNKLNVIQVFTVDDLMHLHRGGRVSKSVAIVGGLVGIKPILHVDDEGKLTAVGKERGRKKSLNYLVEFMGQHLGKFNNSDNAFFISHSDCFEDAKYVSDQIVEKYGITDHEIAYIAPTIGTHTGVGTVALFFMGEGR